MVRGLLLLGLAGCTPLLDLEGPCGHGGCIDALILSDGGAADPDAAADAGALDAAPRDAGPFRPLPDAAPEDAAAADGGAPDAGPDEPATCATACDHVTACLAAECPAVGPADLAGLGAQCLGLCTPEQVDLLIEQPCESLVELLQGSGLGLPSCEADTAPLPAGVPALARFTALAVTTQDATPTCPLVVGQGAAFQALAEGWRFDQVLGPILPGLPGAALGLELEGWPEGKSGNQAGPIQAVLWAAAAGPVPGQLVLAERLASLPGWVHGAALATTPGDVRLPVPVLPPTETPVVLPLRAAHIRGALTVDPAGVALPEAFITGYLDRNALTLLVAQLKERCARPGPLLLEACTRLEAEYHLGRTAEEASRRLWAGLTPDARLLDDGSVGPCGNDVCNAAAACLTAVLAPARANEN